MSNKKAKKTIVKNLCKDCVHSYDYYNISFASGKPIMCKCPFSEFSKLLSWQCDEDKFERKNVQ